MTRAQAAIRATTVLATLATLAALVGIVGAGIVLRALLVGGGTW